ncbi:AraC family transcriptional regulator [bacterium SCSIO 12696]|nr:AraC family transcriptional regulator [bacterium SCSIO 12696]
MEDRLAQFLTHFELRASVFQAGPLCHSGRYELSTGVGYIHVLKQGRVRVELPGQKVITVDKPSLFFCANPQFHLLAPDCEKVEIVCASFKFGVGLSIPVFRALPDMVVLPLAQSGCLAPTLELMFAEAMEHHCGRQGILDRLMEVVFIQVLRELMDQQRLQIGVLAGLSDAKLVKAINAMHSDPARHWSLASLSDVAGMSRARFAVRFKEVVGTTPVAYLSEWRLSIAQSLLREGKSMSFIADRVGYANASALSRAFKAHLGQSPKQWSVADQPG